MAFVEIFDFASQHLLLLIVLKFLLLDEPVLLHLAFAMLFSSLLLITIYDSVSTPFTDEPVSMRSTFEDLFSSLVFIIICSSFETRNTRRAYDDAFRFRRVSVMLVSHHHFRWLLSTSLFMKSCVTDLIDSLARFLTILANDSVNGLLFRVPLVKMLGMCRAREVLLDGFMCLAS